MVTKGAAVVVVSGRKVPVGTTGKAFWVGETKYGVRVGFTTPEGVTHWTAAGNVEPADAPVAVAPVATPVAASVAPSLEKKVEALLALTNVLAGGMMASEAKIVALEAKVAALEAAAAPAPFIPDGVDPFDVHAFTA